MKAILTLGLLLAALSHTQVATAQDVTILGFEWKYAGYERAERIDNNESSVSDDPSTSLKFKTASVYVFKYTAKATLKNTGTKAIKSVSWDYVFTDEKERKELKRYRFQSKQQILPGETQTVSAGLGLDPKEKAPHIKTGKQSVEITKIDYADGSVWKR